MTPSPSRPIDTIALLPVAHRGGAGTPINLSALPLVERIKRELEQPLRELARRARRLGPIEGGTIVLLTGSQRNVGCSTVALALALAAAEERAVLLIDGDLGRPGLSALLLGQPDFGWEDAVKGGLCFEEPSSQPGGGKWLAFLPLRQAVPDPAALLSHPDLPPWLGRLSRAYNLIVLDGGSAQEGAERWAPWAHLALIVWDSSRAPTGDWGATWDRLEEGGTHVLGVIETFA